MENKSNNKIVKIIIIAVIIIVAVIIAVFVLKMIGKNSIKKSIYEGTETTSKVNESNLSDEEKSLYKKAVARGNSNLLNDKTIETIIKEEKDRQTAEKKELEEKRAKEEAEKEAVANAVSLNVYNKNVIEKDTSAYRFNDFVELRMNCKNNTDKDIVAVRGIIHITDLFGNAIIDITLLYDTGIISAKGEVDIKDIGMDINPYIAQHTKLRDTEFEKLIFTFEPKSVAFADGTTIGESK